MNTLFNIAIVDFEALAGPSKTAISSILSAVQKTRLDPLYTVFSVSLWQYIESFENMLKRILDNLNPSE